MRMTAAGDSAGTLIGDVTGGRPTAAERLLRGLARGDETLLPSCLAASASEPRPPWHVLPAATAAVVHLAALLAVGGSTTSLRWGVDLARSAGVREEEIVDVLAAVGSIVGSAQVVATAPRLALAIGYDIEVEGWDGS